MGFENGFENVFEEDFKKELDFQLDMVETLDKSAPIGVPYFRMVLRELKRKFENRSVDVMDSVKIEEH